jgi:hypothetical protein
MIPWCFDLFHFGPMATPAGFYEVTVPGSRRVMGLPTGGPGRAGCKRLTAMWTVN